MNHSTMTRRERAIARLHATVDREALGILMIAKMIDRERSKPNGSVFDNRRHELRWQMRQCSKAYTDAVIALRHAGSDPSPFSGSLVDRADQIIHTGAAS
jgi:hypothetical protein